MVQIIRGTKSKEIKWEIPIEPVEYEPKPVKKRIAVFDTETDPFAPGRVVRPFTCGFYLTDTGEYYDFWGDDCIDQFMQFLVRDFSEKQIELQILVHNGGNFDFYFLVDYFDDGHSPFIINGRLVRIMAGGQEFRDSYSMIPVPLGSYDKIKIDYDLMEKWEVCDVGSKQITTVRELYKADILAYQKRDCTALGELVTEWYEMFGDKLTMASVALPMLRSHHGFENLSEGLDYDLRPYYFGGRNQCFATGILSSDVGFRVYDITSSYPDVMRRYQHPISDFPRYEKVISERTMFAHIRAWSLGALPIRQKDGSLAFPIGTFDFHACIHEIRAGLATGTLRILNVYSSIYFDAVTTFAEFIDRFFELRQIASSSGDEIRKLFYKLVMNSSYGKFAQDPRKYENWLFNPSEPPKPEYCDECYQAIKQRRKPDPCAYCEEGSKSAYGWYLHTLRDGYSIYASPQRLRSGSFFNVATAASITSAARASLLYGIQSAKRPVYCDTDSVICEGFSPNPEWGVVIDDKSLGAWKLEAEADEVCIAGKKLYALFDKGKLVKKACKGVNLTGEEIRRVCGGDVVEYAHPVPKFSLQGDAVFTTRKIRRTG